MSTWILAALLLRACLIATHPFYDARDVVVNDQITGVYSDADLGITATISRTGVRGRYRAVLQERGSRSLYAIVLFRAGRRTFADVSAERVPAVRPPQSGVAPATELLDRATAHGQHLVLRVDVRVDGVTVATPMPDTLAGLWQVEPNLHRRVEEETISILLDGSRTLHDLVARYGQNDSLFSQEYAAYKTRR